MTDKPVRASAARALTDSRDPTTGLLKVICCGVDENGNVVPIKVSATGEIIIVST